MELPQRSDIADSLLSWSELSVIFIKLFLVLLMIYLLFWALRRQGLSASADTGERVLRLWSALRRPNAVAETVPPVRILWSRSVAPAVSLYLLGVGERCVLISATTQDVKVLLELTDKESNNLLHQGESNGLQQP